MNFPNLPEIENFYFDDHDIKTRFLNEVFTGENNKIPFLKKFKNMMHTHFSYSGSWVNGAGDPLNDIALTQPPHIQEELFDLISEYDPEDPISATNANLTYVLQDKVEPELKDFGLELIQKHKIKDWGDNTFATRPTISISDVHLFSTFLKQIRYLDADLTQWIGLIFEATTEHYKDILHNK